MRGYTPSGTGADLGLFGSGGAPSIGISWMGVGGRVVKVHLMSRTFDYYY